MKLKEMLQTVLYTEGDDRIALAKRSLNCALEELPKFDVPKDNYGLFVLALIKLFVRADREVSFEEFSFISEVLNLHIPFQDFVKKMDDKLDDAFMGWVDNLINLFSPDGKEAICLFGLCIMESDDVLTASEQQLFERLIG